MLDGEQLMSIAVFFLLPLGGLLWFVRICKAMRRDRLQDPPERTLFFLLVSYGGLLQMFLAQVIWRDMDFGLATLGAFYLVFVAPVLMICFAINLKKRRHEAPVLRVMFNASWLYFITAPLMIFLAIVIVNMMATEFHETHAQ
jgi:hypothetical protein